MTLIVSLILSFLVFISQPYYAPFVLADEYDTISKELEELKKSLDSSRNATKTNEQELTKLTNRLNQIRAEVTTLEKEIDKKQEEVKEGEKTLVTQKMLLDERTVSHYKNIGRQDVGLIELLLMDNFQETIKRFFVEKSLVDEDKKTIIKVVTYIRDLENKKVELEEEQVKLVAIRAEIDKQSAFLATEVSRSKQFEQQLEKQIATLTTKQKEILARKLTSLNLPSSMGSGTMNCVDDRKLDPGFGAGFAFYTFGIPHRVGMNQYGAFGRAKAGQDYKSILETYYNNTRLECRSTPNKTLQVKGFGTVDVEEYLKGIYEMSASWPIEALKAQVVAARSYAIAFTGNGSKEICTTQACQVYKGGNKGGRWEEAVHATGRNVCADGQGEVLVSNDTGEVISAWYASTSGGYTFNSGDIGWNSKPWTKRLRDTTGDINSINDLFEKAYDKDSPCFYSAQGFRNEYNKSAWLRPEEVADIVNVILLSRKDSSTQTHLSQIDKANPDGVETWSHQKVKDEMKNRGLMPYNNITNVSLSFDLGLGRTVNVGLTGDAGTQNVSADEFKNFFNLRAPANIQIVGGLYNVEKR